ncbi:MAG: dockerin type I repeat-containing protein [Oscillospiraceae bacterium]|nr:dockerin type I repeat-containing protein [Oscillospiraceae bacterium]
MKKLKVIAIACVATMGMTFLGNIFPERVNMIKNASVTASAESEIWDGTADISWYDDTQNSFEISTAEQLAGLSQLVRNGNDMEGKLITLVNDIVLNNTQNFANWETEPPANLWIPIGAYHADRPQATSPFGVNPYDSGHVTFAGLFNGNGHTIKGLYCKHDSMAGLFASVSGGVVRTIIEDGYICSETPEETSWSAHAGGISARSEQGIFNQCEFNGKVYAKRNGYATARSGACVAGGIVGMCEDTGAEFLFVTMVTMAFGFVINPLLLRSMGTKIENQGIYNCINRGSVLADKGNSGGILGWGNTGEAIAHTLFVQNCLNLGEVENGIVGRAYKFTVANCFYTNAEKSITVDTAGDMDLDDSIHFTNAGMSKQEVAEKLGVCFVYQNDDIYLNFDVDDAYLPEEEIPEPTETTPTESPEPTEPLPPITVDTPTGFRHEYPYNSVMNFRWNKVENANGYQLQIAAKTDFNDIAYSYTCSSLASNYDRISNLVAGRTYYLRLRAYVDREEDGQRFYSDWTEHIFTYPPDITLWGDANGDGEFNTLDFVAVQKWLHGKSDNKLPNWKNADYTMDNELNIYDLLLMKKYLIAEQAYTGNYWVIYREPNFNRLQMVRFTAEPNAVLEKSGWFACEQLMCEKQINSPYTIYSFENGTWQKPSTSMHHNNNQMRILTSAENGICASNIDIVSDGQVVFEKTDTPFSEMDFSQFLES